MTTNQYVRQCPRTLSGEVSTSEQSRDFTFTALNCALIFFTNTKALAKEFSKVFIFEYFGYSKKDSNVFLTLIPNYPTWRRVKMQPWGVMGEKLIFMWSRDQCLAKREKRLHLSVELGFGIGLGFVRLRVYPHLLDHWSGGDKMIRGGRLTSLPMPWKLKILENVFGQLLKDVRHSLS